MAGIEFAEVVAAQESTKLRTGPVRRGLFRRKPTLAEEADAWAEAQLKLRENWEQSLITEGWREATAEAAIALREQRERSGAAFAVSSPHVIPAAPVARLTWWQRLVAWFRKFRNGGNG